MVFSCVMIFTRFLDPDPPSLLAELGKSMNKKYHQLNKAITTLVSLLWPAPPNVWLGDPYKNACVGKSGTGEGIYLRNDWSLKVKDIV